MKINYVKYLPWILGCALLALAPVTSCRVNSIAEDNSLETGFQNPPDSVKLGVYWYWIDGQISKEGVTRDLEAMAKVGIGRAYIGNIGLNPGQGDTANQVKLLSDQWWEILKQSFHTGDSVGVDIGMFNGPGWSQSGGPWVKPGQSMRYLTHNELHVAGPATIHEQLSSPDSNFQRTTVLAFPAPKGESNHMQDFSPQLTSLPQMDHLANLIDTDPLTAVAFPNRGPKDTAITLNLSFGKALTARSLLLYPSRDAFKAEVSLEQKEGKSYKLIKKFEFDRTNPAQNVGFMPYGPVAIALPETTGKEFRLVFTNFSEHGGLAEVNLSPTPYLARFVEKQLGKMFQTPQPLWNTYRWEDQTEPDNRQLIIKQDSVWDITSYVSKDGVLNWKVPAGKWIVMQTGMVPTGVTNAPATPEATGLEVDKMSKKDLKAHFDAFIGDVLHKIAASDRKAFKYVVADSYETGSENWTDGFAADFEKRYGYNPLPWLPVMSGRIVGSADASNRFLWDMRRLIADRVAYQYVGGLRELSHENGLKVWLENYGHWGFPAEFLQYGGQSDEVSGEFWAEGDLGIIELKDASSAAHIYGKNKVFAESFTAGGSPFQRYPATLKTKGDWSFTQGVNSTLLHVYISQPKSQPLPGVNAWFGTEFNRNNTWFNHAKPYFDYLRRCNFMLQQGNPVADVAYYIGEDAPKMTGLLEPALPEGYAYDWMNAEVIEQSLRVKDGKLVLPSGISYQMMVLPPETTMRPEVLKKIQQLVADGATILGPKPDKSPSMQNFPNADTDVKSIAAELWQNCDGQRVKMVHYGKGMVLNGMTMQEALKLLKVAPDFNLTTAAPVLYTHRRTKNTDIYFISNQSDTTVRIAPSLRIEGKQPEWWQAVDGSMRILPEYTKDKEGTKIPLTLQPRQSGFVIFRKDAENNAARATTLNFPEEKLALTLNASWTVSFDSTLSGPAGPVTFNQLQDWSKSANDQIKYYSGPAIYKTSFVSPEIPKNNKVYLNLGKVGVIAQISLNGKDVGGAWTAPYQVDITQSLKKGNNQLEIKVVNTWVNRLTGDSKLPVSQRKTSTTVNPYGPTSALDVSGLVGPVSLKTVQY